jgi:Resolvase, N terminal domain
MGTESSNNVVNVKCAIYARSATGDIAAIENQVRLCRAFIQTQPNWCVCEWHIFTDGPASGLSTTRLGLQSLLEAADVEPGRLIIYWLTKPSAWDAAWMWWPGFSVFLAAPGSRFIACPSESFQWRMSSFGYLERHHIAVLLHSND